MKTIGVVAVDLKSYRTFLDELGVYKKEELEKFTFINRIDHIRGREFITVIRAYPYMQGWFLLDVFEQAKARIK